MIARILATAIFASAFLLEAFFGDAYGQPVDVAACPPGAKSCKVVVITPEQENVLDQLITQTCIAGPYAQIGEVVKFYKELLAKAPAGKPAPEPPK